MPGEDAQVSDLDNVAAGSDAHALKHESIGKMKSQRVALASDSSMVTVVAFASNAARGAMFAAMTMSTTLPK